MEKYKDVKNNAISTSWTLKATGFKQKILNKPLQIARQLK